MTFIRLETLHFRTKKMYDADTKSLTFQGYVVTRCPILRYDVLQQTILTTTYWWHHLLSNGGNLFILLRRTNSDVLDGICQRKSVIFAKLVIA